jgi:hypothetical protein
LGSVYRSRNLFTGHETWSPVRPGTCLSGKPGTYSLVGHGTWSPVRPGTCLSGKPGTYSLVGNGTYSPVMEPGHWSGIEPAHRSWNLHRSRNLVTGQA